MSIDLSIFALIVLFLGVTIGFLLSKIFSGKNIEKNNGTNLYIGAIPNFTQAQQDRIAAHPEVTKDIIALIEMKLYLTNARANSIYDNGNNPKSVEKIYTEKGEIYALGVLANSLRGIINRKKKKFEQ